MDNEVDREVAALVDAGIAVIAAAGNDGVRRLVPPASAPAAVTVGGLDDRNEFEHDAWRLWHSNYGETIQHAPKPEIVAPSLHLVAPILPGSTLAAEAPALFDRRGDPEAEAALASRKLVTPHYQHVEGTSFAAPIVAGVVACMLEANPSLSPRRVRELLQAAAHPVPGASPERQGAGAIDAGRAVTLALSDLHSGRADYAASPLVEGGSVRFLLHDHGASSVSVRGSWDGWRAPGLAASRVEDGLWEARLPVAPPGRYSYKFLLDGERWLLDPANPARLTDDAGNWNSVLDYFPGV
jgi:serine protease AprX